MRSKLDLELDPLCARDIQGTNGQHALGRLLSLDLLLTFLHRDVAATQAMDLLTSLWVDVQHICSGGN